MSYSTQCCAKRVNLNRSDANFCGYCGHEFRYDDYNCSTYRIDRR